MWLYARWLLALLLRPGGVPQHVAFIMDGNRRFAADRSMQKIQGHTLGYAKMVEAIHWCLELGVQYISVYAFSIDNFARSLEEVAGLMHLAEEKYEELSQKSGLAERMGVEIRVIGDLSLAPQSVQASAARLMSRTAALPVKHAVLNICFSYSSREEMIHSTDIIREGVQQGVLQQEDVCPQLFLRCLRTQSSPPVDLLVRTSGETRLSDFLLWQSAHAQLHWVPCMWPDWSYFSFLRCIISWQQHQIHQQQLITAAQQRLYSTGQSSASRHAVVEHQQGANKQQADEVTAVAQGNQAPQSHEGHATDASSSNSSGRSSSACHGMQRSQAQVEQDHFMWQPPSHWAPYSIQPGIQALQKALGGARVQRLCSKLTWKSAAQLLQSAAKATAVVAGAAWAFTASMGGLQGQAVCNAAQAAQQPVDSRTNIRASTVGSCWSPPSTTAACQKGDSSDTCSCLKSDVATDSSLLRQHAGVQVAIATFAGVLSEPPCCGMSDASSWTPSTDIASLSMPTSPVDSAPHSPRASLATVMLGDQVATEQHVQGACTAPQGSCTASQGPCTASSKFEGGTHLPIQTQDDENNRLVGCQQQVQEPLQHVQHASLQQPILNQAGCSMQQLDGAMCEVQLVAGSQKAAGSSAVSVAMDAGRRTRILSLLCRQQRLHDDWVHQHASAAASETGES